MSINETNKQTNKQTKTKNTNVVTDYGGAQCGDGVNMCMRLQPCENSAPCTARDGLPGFNCNCFGTGFHGKKCSTVMI